MGEGNKDYRHGKNAETLLGRKVMSRRLRNEKKITFVCHDISLLFQNVIAVTKTHLLK